MRMLNSVKLSVFFWKSYKSDENPRWRPYFLIHEMVIPAETFYTSLKKSHDYKKISFLALDALVGLSSTETCCRYYCYLCQIFFSLSDLSLLAPPQPWRRLAIVWKLREMKKIVLGRWGSAKNRKRKQVFIFWYYNHKNVQSSSEHLLKSTPKISKTLASLLDGLLYL